MSTSRLRRTITGCGAAVAALLATALVAPAAHAAFPGYTTFIRPADFVAPTGTVGDATLSVQADGVHLHTGTAGALAAASFAVPNGGVPFGDFNIYGYHVTYAWTGSAAQPGIHYDIDLDGDGRVDLELVGEHSYGDDMWLNPDQPANPTIAAATIQGAAPCRGAQPQRQLRDGCAASYGSTYHGTMLDWITGFTDAGFGNGRVVKGGFVATGAPVDGVLASMSIGIQAFTFTTNPPVPADLTISVDPAKVAKGGTVTVSGTVANTYNYPHVLLQEKDRGSAWRTIAEQTFTRGSYYSFTTSPSTRGVVRYRTEVPASSYNTDTITHPVRVKVTSGRDAAERHRHHRHRHR